MVPLMPGQKIALQILKEHAIKPDSEQGSEHHYLAFDPGETTGWAEFAENGMPGRMGQIPLWELGLKSWLNSWSEAPEMPRIVICETFRIRGAGQNVDSNMIRTMKVIRVIKDFARKIDAELVEQEAAILGPAQNFSGMHMPRDHSKSHQISAFNHGWFLLQKRNIVIPRIKWPEG